MKKNKFNVGIIGAGNISDIHCYAIKKTGMGNLYGIFDLNKESSERLKNQFSELRVYDSFGIMARDENIDVFAILTPPKAHYETIEKLLNNTDKPIFCEKPLVVDNEEFINILEMQHKNYRIFVGQNYRYFTQIIEAKKYFQKTSDTLKYFEINFRKHIHKIRPIDGWRSEYENYIIEDNGMHMFDLLAHLTGQKIKRIYCQADNFSEKIKGFDTGIINIELEDGAKGVMILEHNNIISNTLYEGKHYYRFNNKTLSLDKEGLIEYIDNEKEVIKKKILVKSPIIEDWKGSFTKMWISFFDNVKNKHQMEICPDNLKNSLEGVLMSVESIRKEKVVKR